jgi:hypothetical protein
MANSPYAVGSFALAERRTNGLPRKAPRSPRTRVERKDAMGS